MSHSTVFKHSRLWRGFYLDFGIAPLLSHWQPTRGYINFKPFDIEAYTQG